MIRKNHWNWLPIALTVVALGATAGGVASAWGPYTQAVIARSASAFSGMPPETQGPDFMNQATMPKPWEYTDRAYAKISPDFSSIMLGLASGPENVCQALAWGAFQSAEIVGDNIFFLPPQINNPYDRWVAELQVDANLFAGDSPYWQFANEVGVSCRPKLIAGASKAYTDINGGLPISAADAVLQTYDLAMTMLGEKVVISNSRFAQNAMTMIPSGIWQPAFGQSVNKVIEYVSTHSVPISSPPTYFGDPAGTYGRDLLYQLGRLLVAAGEAQVTTSTDHGTIRHKFDIHRPDSADSFMLNYLEGVTHDLGADPLTRHLAATLLELCVTESPDYVPFFGADSHHHE